MATIEEKIDALSDKVYSIHVAVAGLDTRITAIEDFLHEERDCHDEIESDLHGLQQELAVAKGISDAKNSWFNRLQPFLVVCFSSMLAVLGAILLNGKI